MSDTSFFSVRYFCKIFGGLGSEPIFNFAQNGLILGSLANEKMRILEVNPTKIIKYYRHVNF